MILAASSGIIDDVEVSQVRRFESELMQFLETNQQALLQKVREKKALDDATKQEATQAFQAFKERWTASTGAKA